MKKVAVIMGSDSDLPVVEGAFGIFEKFGVPYDVFILSAHRTPDEVRALASSAREGGYGVLIAAAGMAAHLAGAVAAVTTLPVIGIPVKSGPFEGVDALLSTVQMPSGIPVATVSVNGAKNAAILAAEILSVTDEGLARGLEEYRREGAEAVLKKNEEIGSKYRSR